MTKQQREVAARERDRQLDELYASIPRIDCRRLCVDSCGPIVYHAREKERMAAVAGAREPDLQRLVCGYFEDGACAAHQARPALCRLYGVVRAMRCRYGCVPERWLSDEEAQAILVKLREIGGPRIVPDLPLAVRIGRAT